MNLGNFYVRAEPLAEGQRAPSLAVRCMACETDITPYVPGAYEAGTTLAVLVLDARTHVHANHPGESWKP